MIPFQAPVDDILFSLEHVAGAARLETWDAALAAEIIRHYALFVEAVIAPIDAVGDLQGCRLEDGRVLLPEEFVEAYRAIVEQGWQATGLPAEHGGMGLSGVIEGVVSEMFAGACHSLQMVTGLVPGAVRTIQRFGSLEQQARCLPQLCSGDALATMCLTEAAAGSDLSAIRTRATRVEGKWRIDGEKIFISGGDQNLSDIILHLVLARTSEAGIKGLSLFICQTGGQAGRNGVCVARIEEKLGLHASPTCQMVFDDTHAELLGTEGQGLAAMFTLMNHARLDVARQGVAHAARASQLASAYAKDRKQGRKQNGDSAVLADHADVRRMLDEQRALAIGARTMCQIASVELELAAQPDLVEFLTPVCKVFATEAGIRAADLGIQVFGGYGYLTEYRISQTWRDARITAIYEGANGIHERAIATRGLSVNGGAGADAFDVLIDELVSSENDLFELREAWRRHRAELLACDDPSLHAHDFAQLTAEIFYRAVWIRIANVSKELPQSDEMLRLCAQVQNRALPVRLY